MSGMYQGRTLLEFCQENNCSVWIKKDVLAKKEDVYKKMEELAKKLNPEESPGHGIYRFGISPYQKMGSKEIQILPFIENSEKVRVNESGERQLFLPSLKNLFCLNKEGSGISVYAISGKDHLLSRYGSIEKGDEMLFYSSPRERMASLFQGKVNNNNPLLLGKEALSDYPYVYDERHFGFSFYGFESTMLIRNILSQSMKKYANLTEEDHYFLSYLEIDKADLLEKEFIFKENPLHGIFQQYFLQQLNEKLYRLSLIVEKVSHQGSSFEVANQIFLSLNEKGKVSETSFVRDFNGQWKKLLKSIVINKSDFKKYQYISNENTGFLKYIIQKSSYVHDLKSGYQADCFENLISFDGIYQVAKKYSVSSYLAFPRKKKINEAFGLSLGHLRLLDEFTCQKVFETPVYQKNFFQKVLRPIKKLAKDPRMARINNEDFKKIFFFLFFNEKHFHALDQVYVKKEDLFKKTMDAAKDFAVFWEKQQEDLREIFQRNNQILGRLRITYFSLYDEINRGLKEEIKSYFSTGKRNIVYENLREQGNLLYSYRTYSLSNIFYRQMDYILEKRESGADLFLHLDEMAENTPHYELMRCILFVVFLDPERKESLRRYTDSFSEKDFLEEILLKKKNVQFLNYFYPEEGFRGCSFLNREGIYRDLLDMISLFPVEEIDAMDLSFKCSLAADKIKMQHDRLKKVYELRKNAHLDIGIAKAKESGKKLEYESDDFILTMPGSFSDLAKEGTQLGHCVATYGQKVAKGQTKIFFVRKKEEPEKPYFTVELLHKKVEQIQGANLLRLSESMIDDAGEENKKVYAFLSNWAKKNLFEMI